MGEAHSKALTNLLVHAASAGHSSDPLVGTQRGSLGPIPACSTGPFAQYTGFEGAGRERRMVKISLEIDTAFVN